MSLWVTNDVLRQERLNRGAIIGRLVGLPIYDVDDALAVTLTAKPLDGVAIASSSTTYYTVPGSGVAVSEILTITLVNTDSVARAVDLHLVESGGGPVVATSIFPGTLQPGERVTLEGPWFLAVGDTLRASAAAAAVVSLRAEILEYAAQPAGLTLKVINGAALGSSVATYYTVPGSGVTHAILLATTLANTDSVSRTPHVHVIPSGGAAAVANRVWSDALVTKETALFAQLEVLEPGDFIQAKADAAAVVGARFTVLEVE